MKDKFLNLKTSHKVIVVAVAVIIVIAVVQGLTGTGSV